jgi:hypothetical protein
MTGTLLYGGVAGGVAGGKGRQGQGYSTDSDLLQESLGISGFIVHCLKG